MSAIQYIIHRPHRVIARRFRPVVTRLEERTLLDGSAPGLFFYEGVGTRNGDPSALYSAVGAATTAMVTPADEHGFLTVTYHISGAVDPDGIDYSLQGGTYQRLATSIVHDFHDQGGNFQGPDYLGWDWDETTGPHSVAVDVVYEDGSTASKTLTVNVEAPTVDDFTILGRRLEFGTYNDNWNHQTDPNSVFLIGFAQPEAEAEIYQAHIINNTVVGGMVYFLQTVTATMSFHYTNGFGMSFNSVGDDLDSTGDNVEYAPGTMIGSGQQGWLPGDGYSHIVHQRDGTDWWNSPYISDSPTYTRGPIRATAGYVLDEVHMDYRFETHLMFVAETGGCPVVLSTVQWQLKGDATLPAANQNYQGQMNELAWAVTIAGDGEQNYWSKSGDNTRKLLRYTKNVSQDITDQGFQR